MMIKILYSKYLALFFLIQLFGCEQDYVEPSHLIKESAVAGAWKKPAGNCPEYFYFYEKTKVVLGEVNTSKIVVGFQDGVTTEQKETLIAKYPILQSIQSEFNTGSADATIILLKEGLTCAQVEDALNQLAFQPEVRYANPFFQSPFDTSLLGVTNQFIVNLAAGYTLNDLEKLTKRTKTQIVEQLGELTFILSADKYATGNALQLANEFAQFYQVESSEPDFLFNY